MPWPRAVASESFSAKDDATKKPAALREAQSSLPRNAIHIASRIRLWWLGSHMEAGIPACILSSSLWNLGGRISRQGLPLVCPVHAHSWRYLPAWHRGGQRPVQRAPSCEPAEAQSPRRVGPPQELPICIPLPMATRCHESSRQARTRRGLQCTACSNRRVQRRTTHSCSTRFGVAEKASAFGMTGMRVGTHKTGDGDVEGGTSAVPTDHVDTLVQHGHNMLIAAADKVLDTNRRKPFILTRNNPAWKKEEVDQMELSAEGGIVVLKEQKLKLVNHIARSAPLHRGMRRPHEPADVSLGQQLMRPGLRRKH